MTNIVNFRVERSKKFCREIQAEPFPHLLMLEAADMAMEILEGRGDQSRLEETLQWSERILKRRAEIAKKRHEKAMESAFSAMEGYHGR